MAHKFESAPQEKAPEQEIPKQESRVEEVENKDRNIERIEGVDDFFDKILKEVEGSPEVQDATKKEAIEILIQQIREQVEQLKQIRDMKRLHEIKIEMGKRWKELEEFVDGDKKLLESIQNWGRKFVQEKILYYDLIGELKDEFVDEAHEMQKLNNDFLVNSQIALKNTTSLGLELTTEEIVDDAFKRNNALNREFNEWIEGLINYDEHYFSGVRLEGINSFIQNLTDFMLRMEKGFTNAETMHAISSKYPGASEFDNLRWERATKAMDGMRQQSAALIEKIRNLQKRFKVLKKIQETHFLPLYNEHPGIEEPEAQAA